MPLVIMSSLPHSTVESEYDLCGMCGTPTPLLLWVRVGDQLLSFCGPCIEAMNKGHEQMTRDWLAWLERHPED